MFTASMRFDLGEDVEALREAVHRWAQERVKPLAGEIDRSNTFPPALWKEMGEMGLLGITVPEEFGGAGRDHFVELRPGNDLIHQVPVGGALAPNTFGRGAEIIRPVVAHFSFVDQTRQPAGAGQNRQQRQFRQ